MPIGTYRYVFPATKESRLLPPSIRRRLTFSNVIALTALALALGGVSYAAVTLPDHSVGTRQLQGHSVTAGKIAKGAVKRRALSNSLRKRIAKLNSGAAAQAVGRIHYSDTSSASPASKTVLDFAGLKLTATCSLSGSTTALTMSAKSQTSALLTSNFNVDAGTDPSSPGHRLLGQQPDRSPGRRRDLAQRARGRHAATITSGSSRRGSTRPPGGRSA